MNAKMSWVRSQSLVYGHYFSWNHWWSEVSFVMHCDGVSSVYKHHSLRSFGIRSGCLFSFLTWSSFDSEEVEPWQPGYIAFVPSAHPLQYILSVVGCGVPFGVIWILATQGVMYVPAASQNLPRPTE